MDLQIKELDKSRELALYTCCHGRRLPSLLLRWGREWAVFPYLDFASEAPTYLFINEQIPSILRLSSSWSRSLILNCIEALCKGRTRFETVIRSARYSEHDTSIGESLWLISASDLYVLNQCHVIRYAEVCGVIVSVEQTYNTIIYTGNLISPSFEMMLTFMPTIVDDATATLQCCQWKNQGKIIKPLPLGTTVCVRGRINDFRDTRQINIQQLGNTLHDPL